MKSVQLSVQTTVTVQGDIALVLSPGAYDISGVTNVFATNGVSTAVNVSEGGSVIVDASGAVLTVGGPDVVLLWSIGFSAAWFSVGAIRGIRWLVSRFSRQWGAAVE